MHVVRLREYVDVQPLNDASNVVAKWQNNVL